MPKDDLPRDRSWLKVVNDRRLHFGLGKAQTADLKVRWTNGAVEEYQALPAGRLYVIREGQGIVRRDVLPAKP